MRTSLYARKWDEAAAHDIVILSRREQDQIQRHARADNMANVLRRRCPTRWKADYRHTRKGDEDRDQDHLSRGPSTDTRPIPLDERQTVAYTPACIRFAAKHNRIPQLQEIRCRRVHLKNIGPINPDLEQHPKAT